MFTFFRIVLLALWLGATAASADELTVADAVRRALADNPELRAARQKVEAATGRATQARLWSNPELEFSVEDFPPSGSGFSSSQNMIGLSQTVPFPGKKGLDRRIGAKEVTAAEWDYLGKELTFVRDVRVAFYRALTAERKLAVSEQLLALAESLADAARKRVAAGATADQEQLRAEIEQERAAVELAAARRELTEAQRGLATLMGRAREPLGPLQGELADRVSPTVLDDARTEILTRNPGLRSAVANRERAELESRRAKLEPLPDVRLGVAGGRDEAVNETLMEFRISLPLPLFDRAQGRKKEMRALAEMARYDATATEQRLIQEMEVIGARLNAAGRQVEAYRERILPKGEEALRMVRDGFEAGKFGFLDLVDTQRTVAEARLAYYEKLLELNTAQSDMEVLLLKDLRTIERIQP